jgi:hypothetical protein
MMPLLCKFARASCAKNFNHLNFALNGRHQWRFNRMLAAAHVFEFLLFSKILYILTAFAAYLLPV